MCKKYRRKNPTFDLYKLNHSLIYVFTKNQEHVPAADNYLKW